MIVEYRASFACFLPFFADRLFCDLPLKSLKSLARIKHKRRFRKGTDIFARSDLPGCIYSLLEGQAQIFLNEDPRIFRSVEPDEILGLTKIFAALSFEIGLITITPCEFEYIENGDFLRFLHAEPEVCFRIVKLLGANLQESYKLYFSSINQEFL